jgi:DNA-directed RNA polymerase specialized sigma24 family protein
VIDRAGPVHDPSPAHAEVHVRLAYHFVDRLAHRFWDAQVGRRPDLWQDFRSAAHEALADAYLRYDPAGAASWPTYLRNRVYYACLMALRDCCPLGYRRSGDAPAVVALGDIPVVAPAVDVGEEAGTLGFADLVGVVTPLEAEALRLVHEEGLGLSGAARALGISVRSLATRVERGRARVLAALADLGRDDAPPGGRRLDYARMAAGSYVDGGRIGACPRCGRRGRHWPAVRGAACRHFVHAATRRLRGGVPREDWDDSCTIEGS